MLAVDVLMQAIVVARPDSAAGAASAASAPPRGSARGRRRARRDSATSTPIAAFQRSATGASGGRDRDAAPTISVRQRVGEILVLAPAEAVARHDDASSGSGRRPGRAPRAARQASGEQKASARRPQPIGVEVARDAPASRARRWRADRPSSGRYRGHLLPEREKGSRAPSPARGEGWGEGLGLLAFITRASRSSSVRLRSTPQR